MIRPAKKFEKTNGLITRLKNKAENFLSAPLAGVDLEADTLRVVSLLEKNGTLYFEKVIVEKLGDNAIDSIKSIWARHLFKSKNIALGISSPEVIVRPFTFPAMPKNEFAKAIQLESESATLNGHKPSEMAVDWHILNSQNHLRGILAVMPKEILAEQASLFEKSELNPVIVDIKALALWNAYWVLCGKEQLNSPTTLLINLERDTTHLVIAKGADDLKLVRDINLGYADFSEGHLGDWGVEIHDSLLYARAKGGLRELDQALLTGRMDEIALEHLDSILPVSTEAWNPIDFISSESGNGIGIDRIKGATLSVAIGLTLREIKR
jgi:Tfp pilus assembly PilM family ATPase